MTYEIRFKASAWKALTRLDERTRSRLEKAIYALAENPRPPGCRKLVGARDLYRIRVGSNRVVYGVEDEVLVVVVIDVGHRRDVYRRIWRS